MSAAHFKSKSPLLNCVWCTIKDIVFVPGKTTYVISVPDAKDRNGTALSVEATRDNFSGIISISEQLHPKIESAIRSCIREHVASLNRYGID